MDLPNSVWVFGYGSLLWKPGFPYQEKAVGHVRGYARRFWQASTHHRGTPETPGRVVTLVEEAEESTWGVAYKVNPADVPEVLAYLDDRERGGYITRELLFHPQDQDLSPFVVLVYTTTTSSENYVGPAPIETIAECVVQSRGLSGNNIEYVLMLARSLREIAPTIDDQHLFTLESKVREIAKEMRGGEEGSGDRT